MPRRSLVLVTGVFVSLSFGQTPSDGVQMGYVSNLDQGDSYINITNSGANGAFLGFGGANGNFCANVYVFNPQQALVACCSCLTTPDGLYSLSIRSDLISRTLTAGVPTSVVVKLTATAPPSGASSCNNSAALAISPSNSLVSGLRAWATTLHQNPAGGYSSTENSFQAVTASSAEITALPMWCGFVLAEGSGLYGICNSCRASGLGGVSKK